MTLLGRTYKKVSVASWLLLSGLFLASILIGWFIAFFGEPSYLLVLGVLATAFLILLAMQYERLPFYLFVTALCLDPIFDVAGIPIIPTILFGLTILIWLPQLAMRRTTFICERRSALFAIPLVIWATISTIYAEDIGAIGYILPYFEAIAVFFLAQNLLRNKQHLERLGWVLVIACSLFGAFAFFLQVQAFMQAGGTLTARQLHVAGRAVGRSADSAPMLITRGVPFALYLFTTSAKRYPIRRYLLVFCLIFTVLGTLAVVAVGGTIGLIAAFAMVMLLRNKPAQRVRSVVLTTIMILAVLVSPVAERFEDQWSAIVEGQPLEWASGRGLVWSAALQVIQDSPWLGQGPNPDAVSSAMKDRVPVGSQPDTLERLLPHNIFLRVGTELGLPGLFMYISLIVASMLPLWQEIRRRRTRLEDTDLEFLGIGQAIFVASVVFLIQGVAIHLPLQPLFWIVLGAGVAFTRMSKHVYEK
ncbi:MAG: O-antigen ligase family protein [Promethearchaeota archaeon]